MRAGARGRGYLAWTLAVPLAGGLAGSATADVRITSSVSVETTYTDNEDFEPNGKSAGIISISPGIRLIQTGGRSTTSLDYSLSTQYSTRGSDVDVVHSLDAFNNLELLRNFFFVDTAAAVSQRVIDTRLGTPVRRADESNNLTTVQRYSVSPYIVNRWGSFATSQIRARAGYVDSGSTRLDSETQYSLSAFLASGPDFSRFSWTVSSAYEVEEGDGEKRTTETVNLDTATAIDRTFSLLAGIGHQKIDDDSFAEKIDEITWDVGFDWRPGTKAHLVATYGERFEEDNLSVDFSYRATARTTLFANYSQTLTTEQALLLDELSFVGVDEDGNLIDIRTGLPIDGREDLFGLSDQTFRRDVFTAGISTSRDRDTFSLDGSYETRDFGTGAADDTILGAEFGWTHRLSRSMTSTLSAGYDNISFGAEDEGREDDLYTFRASLSEQFAQSVTGAVNYLFRTRDSNLSGQDATENAVVLSFTKTF